MFFKGGILCNYLIETITVKLNLKKDWFFLIFYGGGWEWVCLFFQWSKLFFMIFCFPHAKLDLFLTLKHVFYWWVDIGNWTLHCKHFNSSLHDWELSDNTFLVIGVEIPIEAWNYYSTMRQIHLTTFICWARTHKRARLIGRVHAPVSAW